jgi:hypothetical protein
LPLTQVMLPLQGEHFLHFIRAESPSYLLLKKRSKAKTGIGK